ncbi:UNVERIFIED_CONTAM: hypothetical protein K2H54_064544 [Gekko kuhli]
MPFPTQRIVLREGVPRVTSRRITDGGGELCNVAQGSSAASVKNATDGEKRQSSVWVSASRRHGERDLPKAPVNPSMLCISFRFISLCTNPGHRWLDSYGGGGCLSLYLTKLEKSGT